MPILRAVDGAPRQSEWQLLLATALDLFARHCPGAPLRFGGGTALATWLGHRVSYDVNLFVDSPQILGFVSPRLNDAAAAVADRGYVEQGDSLKLRTRHGDIDVIVRMTLTDQPASPFDAPGSRTVLRETPQEILAKKLLYRGAQFAHRDVFDLRAIARSRPDAVRQAAAAAGDRALRDTLARLRAMAPTLDAEMPREVVPLAAWHDLLAGGGDAIRILEEACKAR